MEMETPYVIPGDRLGKVDEYRSGSGTYVRGQHVYAGVVGPKTIVSVEEDGALPIITVAPSHSSGGANQVVEVGNIVMGRVTRTTNRQVNLEIICVESTILREPYGGVIRKEDVRAMEIDKVVIHECFRPGDIVRARVISLGDTRQYYLSTAENDLGVRWAKSMAGAIMTPVSWQEMQCPVTNQTEPRKCAKPV
mmetsp:Transcript_29758/g.38455  ORF Transcript_29758/g.38455 Transcript_29758/m.38455 type:complete len:194 (-) Transcript_29758:483-1064(-)